MPTCRDVITRALRKIGDIGRNESPSQADEDMGMSALQNLFDGWTAGGAFGPLRDVHKTSDYTARAGERVRTTFAVTLPTYVSEDGLTYADDYGFGACREDRPRNRSLIVVVNPSTGERQTNIWDAWRGGWIRIEALKPADEAPLAALGADDLACCLARQVADETGAVVSDDTRRRATAFEARMKQRTDSARTPTPVEFF